jgi:hypothetical protein
MKDEIISLFIDDEMDLEDKIIFVETVHSDSVFTEETLDLLKQEKLLATHLSISRPMPRISSFKYLWPLINPFKTLMLVLATAMVIILITCPKTGFQEVWCQFAISKPDLEKADNSIIFTPGKPFSVKFSDRNGYWKDSIEPCLGGNEYIHFLDWKISAAKSRSQFRENLKFSHTRNDLHFIELMDS